MDDIDKISSEFNKFKRHRAKFIGPKEKKTKKRRKPSNDDIKIIKET